MFVPFLVFRNAFRHKLRTTLTIIGIVVAIVAFGLLRTIVDAWYLGAEATSSARLVTRNSISLVFPLPYNYAQKIRQVPGVTAVAAANWFGGVYITESNFFPQLAIDPGPYLDMYPEYRLSDAERKAFLLDRQGAVVGRRLAERFGWKIGDRIPLRGTIYPGTWTFTLRGIYDGADAKVDENQFFFHWALLNERIKQIYPRRADSVGVYIVEINEPGRAAAISEQIDAVFKNSLAETLTETEKAFQLGFVAMTETILVAVQAVSFVIILIIMAVMANTMAMTARERYSEYATLKAIGFSNGFVAFLIFAESLGIALVGGAIGIALTFPVTRAFGAALANLFPIFAVSRETILMQVGCALVVGVIAALIPAWRAARVRIVDGLRAIA
ncbi:MAG: ABC transporter permease [Burkholderiales bacterium]|nr:ABC transporter permease [Burkholderiales bacterium]